MLIALIPIMYAIPSILLGQFADRRNNRKIIIYFDWFRAVLTLLLVFTPTPWLACQSCFYETAGLMRKIVDEKTSFKQSTINGSLFQLVKGDWPAYGRFSGRNIFSERFHCSKQLISLFKRS